MRSWTHLPTVLLSLAHHANAINSAFAHSFALLADMGLNPDGTPISSDSSSPSFSDFDSFSISSVQDDASHRPPPETIVPEYVKLPVDNFAASKNQAFDWHGTFWNRFWVSSRAYKPGAPVFLYDVGESDASTNALYRLQDETSFFRQIVEQYHGIGIVWEHRFYGNSSPTLVDINTPAEDFRFLNTEQSLADIKRFADQFHRRDQGINHTLTPDVTPWVFVGGSYPGMRAAFMRDKYPDTIFAAFASSAPVQAAIDQSFYFEPMWRGLNAYGFGNCTRDVQAAVRFIDRMLDSNNKTAIQQLKVLFLGKGAEKNSHATFADALTTIFAAWMSYGVEGGVQGLRRFCDWIETDTDGNKPVVAGADGWNKKKGVQWVVERWASYPWFVGNVNKYMETECSGRDNIVGNCDLNKKFTEPNIISWTWQYCTQWGMLSFSLLHPQNDKQLTMMISGFFQSANLGPHQLVSKYNSLAHWKEICDRQFPSAPRDIFPAWPDVSRTNRYFGGWSIRPSNTYWSNGEFDPWRTLTPASIEARRGVGELFGYVIPDAQHCYDFRTTGTTAKGGEVSRNLFAGALGEWLKCWRPKKKPPVPPGLGGRPPGRPWKG
ncbi:serine carboxypeptidase S28-domain-containing protein [Phaeosphaeria sp. MPI-PUGE-AT-0046c]|nr:serine carboxypeptidase S28-domain-containing protein [Phaeosphaeria sp. MPI-PUGE-AT-0046c]